MSPVTKLTHSVGMTSSSDVQGKSASSSDFSNGALKRSINLTLPKGKVLVFVLLLCLLLLLLFIIGNTT